VKRIQLLLILGVVLSLAMPAQATIAAHWPREWDNLPDVRVLVASDAPAPFNTGTARAEILNGRVPWNVAPNTESLDFILGDADGLKAMGTPSSLTLGDVPGGQVWIAGQANMGNGLYGITFTDSGGIAHALTKLNTNPATSHSNDWHISSSQGPVASQATDLRSVVTHELGHSIGAPDWTNSPTLLCWKDLNNYANSNTMCAGSLVDHTGNTVLRDLESHELGDFQARY
jgi:hypothetical protein